MNNKKGVSLWNKTRHMWMKSNPQWWGRKWEELTGPEQYRWTMMGEIYG